jgi:tyrosyl-tRNA synthetase
MIVAVSALTSVILHLAYVVPKLNKLDKQAEWFDENVVECNEQHFQLSHDLLKSYTTRATKRNADKIDRLESKFAAANDSQEIRILVLMTAVRNHVGERRWQRAADEVNAAVEKELDRREQEAKLEALKKTE